MSRKIGSRVFRRELDDHEERLAGIEKSGGGGGETDPPTTISDVIDGDPVEGTLLERRYVLDSGDVNRFLIINDPGEAPEDEPEEEGEESQVTTNVVVPLDEDMDTPFPPGARFSVMFDLDPEEDTDTAGNVTVVSAEGVTIYGRSEAVQEPIPVKEIFLSDRPASFVTILKIAPDTWVLENLRGAQVEG